ncbi:MAG: GntR family transcriptional regulator [Anaerolineaceae bacterium]|nr:GntR family transcriptional regulator [Anaerolineaceae bacterium]
MNSNDVFELPPHATLEAQVLERLRKAILNGIFEPGGQLNHVQLAAQFGVSRGPIRAALGKLEEEGLVNHVPHRGTFVSVLERKTVQDLYKIRAILEQYATQLAVQNATQEDLEHLNALLKQIQKAAREKDASKVVWSDFAIHQYIIDLSGNSFLQQIWGMLQLHVRWALSDRFRGYENLVEIADSHISLMDKFWDKDAEGAGQVMWSHIIDALNDLEAKWEKNRPDKKGE